MHWGSLIAHRQAVLQIDGLWRYSGIDSAALRWTVIEKSKGNDFLRLVLRGAYKCISGPA